MAEDAHLESEVAKECLIHNLNEAARRRLEVRLETAEDETFQLLPVEERLRKVSYEKVLAILKSQSMLDEATRWAKLGKHLQPSTKEGKEGKEGKPVH